MEQMKLIFLGTGNSIPTEKRNHSAILVSYKNENILIDCGENTQKQFRIAKLSMHKITRILITHWHGDHILGLPGLFQTLSLTDFKGKIILYGPENTSEFLPAIKKLSTNFNLNLEVHEVKDGIILNTKDFCIESKRMLHGIPTNAYSIIIKDRIHLDKKKLRKLKLPNSPLLKQLQQGKDITINNKKIKASQVTYKEKGKKLTIILDTIFNENAVQLAKNSDILISESAFSQEEAQRAREYKHMTAQEAATIAKKAKVKKLILTHLSQRYEHNPKIIEKQAKKIFKNTILAKDFNEFVI